MSSKIDTNLFIEAWEIEPALWNVNSAKYKNRNTRTKSLKKLEEQFNVSGSLLFIITLFLAFETVLVQGYNKLLFGKFEENFLIFLEGDIKTKINTIHVKMLLHRCSFCK